MILIHRTPEHGVGLVADKANAAGISAISLPTADGGTWISLYTDANGHVYGHWPGQWEGYDANGRGVGDEIASELGGFDATGAWSGAWPNQEALPPESRDAILFRLAVQSCGRRLTVSEVVDAVRVGARVTVSYWPSADILALFDALDAAGIAWYSNEAIVGIDNNATARRRIGGDINRWNSHSWVGPA